MAPLPPVSIKWITLPHYILLAMKFCLTSHGAQNWAKGPWTEISETTIQNKSFLKLFYQVHYCSNRKRLTLSWFIFRCYNWAPQTGKFIKDRSLLMPWFWRLGCPGAWSQHLLRSGEGSLLHHNMINSSKWQDSSKLAGVFSSSYKVEMSPWEAHPHDFVWLFP
jgi:hypothetical protein